MQKTEQLTSFYRKKTTFEKFNARSQKADLKLALRKFIYLKIKYV